MVLNIPLIKELKFESGNTRKILERVPTDKLQWQPHEKSMTIGRLASHIAEIPMWITRTIQGSELDFSTMKFSRITYENTDAILKVFDEKLNEAIALLEESNDEALNGTYTLKRAGAVLSERPRVIVIRNYAYNHLIHHRGQLSVYLRLLDIPVPGMYGPSADELKS
ncbi:MAG: damage-inducible protein DinB [Bacteroidetes bacterium]|nr:MAG: damage-inducible protein DinB [Bacteroidota bacterium]